MLHPNLQVYKALDEAGVSSKVSGLEKNFEENECPFSGLETHYRQLQYLKANFNFIVSTNSDVYLHTCIHMYK